MPERSALSLGARPTTSARAPVAVPLPLPPQAGVRRPFVSGLPLPARPRTPLQCNMQSKPAAACDGTFCAHARTLGVYCYSTGDGCRGYEGVGAWLVPATRLLLPASQPASRAHGPADAIKNGSHRPWVLRRFYSAIVVVERLLVGGTLPKRDCERGRRGG